MKLYLEIIKALFGKMKGYENGRVIKQLCENMGVTYIKIAQILSTQNYGNLFTEKDRLLIQGICDDCNKISFDQIKKILDHEYDGNFQNIFSYVDSDSKSASISQVHKAILKNGDVVAVKVKRKDITDKIEKDIKQMRKLMHLFGRFFHFKNSIGGDKTLDLYLKWIYEETDFVHEVENIKKYQDFANRINGKIENSGNIKIPKVYEEFCTENIIVMEYIDRETINHLPLNQENKERIVYTFNDYLKLNFYALLHNEQIVFHGDPHGGNIYLDDDNNIGFLDMGLIFELSKEDQKLLKDFFLNAYSGNYNNLYQSLVRFSSMNQKKKEKFKNDIKIYCEEVKEKEITYYFTDMINICMKYNFSPPTFLFSMAKSFVCLNGINHLSNNFTNARELLQEQTVEYLIERSLNDCRGVVKESLRLAPDILKNTAKYGLVKSIAKEAPKIETVTKSIDNLLEHYRQMREIIYPSGETTSWNDLGSKMKK